MSGNGHDYTERFGTQEEQAARQASVGTIAPDGPFRLERWQIGEDGKGCIVVLPNSVRSTYSEAKRLHDEEHARTDIRWGIARCPELGSSQRHSSAPSQRETSVKPTVCGCSSAIGAGSLSSVGACTVGSLRRAQSDTAESLYSGE